MTAPLNVDAIRSEIRLALINKKANACPMAARVAWHAAGAFDAADGSGGTDGATMRFEPEKSDPANAGLSIIRDMLHPVKVNHPELSEADLWGLAGSVSEDGGRSSCFLLVHYRKFLPPLAAHSVSADMLTFDGAHGTQMAVEFLGGPHIPYSFGRTDDTDGARCPCVNLLTSMATHPQHSISGQPLYVQFCCMPVRTR